MDSDSLERAAARGNIRIGSWPAQGVERRLRSLEFMIEAWRDPNIEFYKSEYDDIAPGKVSIVARTRTQNPLRKATEDDVEALEVGIRNCRKLLDRLGVLLEVVPTATLLSSINTGSLELKNPPPGWWPEKVAAHAKKVRETLAEIDRAIQDLNLLEDSITTR